MANPIAWHLKRGTAVRIERDERGWKWRSRDSQQWHRVSLAAIRAAKLEANAIFLGRGTYNQNLLAWFGFEEAARWIADANHYEGGK